VNLTQFGKFSEYSDNSTKNREFSDNLQDAPEQGITKHLLRYHWMPDREK